MKINSISKAQTFGIKMPENFAEKISKNCIGVSVEKAENLVSQLKTLGDDSFRLVDLISSCEKKSLLARKQCRIGIKYEQVDENKTVKKCSYSDIIQRNTPFSPEEIIQKITQVLSKTEKKKH